MQRADSSAADPIAGKKSKQLADDIFYSFHDSIDFLIELNGAQLFLHRISIDVESSQ